jgi:tetratricopeptide (TPR) repeat protein
VKATWLVVAALMAALYASDKFLAKLETREVTAEAQNLYRNGRKLLAGGKAAEAVDILRRAHAMERTNRSFDLALADAQLTAGRTEDAERTLNELLDRNSNDGRANFLMARVRTAQDRFEDSVAFYHRAIYGSWTDGGARDKMDARLELADQLARRGRTEELLSELLLLDGAAAGDPQVALKLAGLYLEAGSATRAETAYRALIAQDPQDADAYEGLGEAELRRGEYRMAHAAFGAVLKNRPGDQKAEAQLRLTDRLVGLDPTSRRLGSQEKFRRSQEILSLVEEETSGCLKDQTVPDALRELLEQSARLRAEKAAAMPSNEAAESRLELAVQIWKARLQVCTAKPAEDDPLRIIIAKMEQ